MIAYLNFFLLCILLALLHYLQVRGKTLLKMAESGIDNLISGGYDSQQSDSKRQKLLECLLECILTGNNKLYLGKVHTEERVNELSDEEVDKLLYSSKIYLNYT